jgi:protein-disulfide isomerase
MARPSKSSDAERRKAQAAALRAEQAARDRRRRNLIGGITAVALLAIIVAVGIAIQSNRSSGGGDTPTGVTADGGIVAGSADAPVQVTIYEDFQCPACQAFEAQTGGTVSALLEEDAIRVTYRPIAFLDHSSTDNYSTRALNAAACVINSDPAAFQAFHDALFVQQPAEGGPGLTADQLTSIATQAGADDPKVGTCIQDQPYEGWTADVTDAASKAGVNQTPTVLVAGEPLENTSPAGLRAAVQTAAATSAGETTTSAG